MEIVGLAKQTGTAKSNGRGAKGGWGASESWYCMSLVTTTTSEAVIDGDNAEDGEAVDV